MRRSELWLFAAWSAALLARLTPALSSSAWSISSFGDLYSYHYPMRHLAASALEAGRVPFWNPYIFCGLPLSANSQAVLFYPVSVLSWVLPLASALSWDCVFHWLWAGLGMVLLAKRNALDGAGAFFLATIFCLSPFLVYRMTEGIPTLLAGLSWTPWCWLAMQARRPGLLAAVWALQFLSGHPQFLLVNALAMALWSALQAPRAALLGYCVKEGLGAALLALVQWAPTYEFLSRSVRAIWGGAFTTAYSLSPAMLRTWASPGALGDPLAGGWPDVPSVFFECCGVHIGRVGLLAAAAGAWFCLRAQKRRAGLSAAALVLLGLFFAAGGHNPLYRAGLAATPLGFLRTPARWALATLWGLLLFAGAGAARAPRAWRWTAVAVAFIELMSWDRRFLACEKNARYLGVNSFVADWAGGMPLRVMTDPDLASPNKSMLYRAMNVNGYEAFYLADFPAYAAKSEGCAAADPSRSYLRRYDSPQMNRASLGYFVAQNGQLTGTSARLPLAYFADQNGPRTSPVLRVALDRPERWRVFGSIPEKVSGLRLVLAEPYYPGWRAWVGGRGAALQKWDGFFQSIEVAPEWAGQKLRLTFNYEPRLWSIFCAASAGAWFLWLARERRRLA